MSVKVRPRVVILGAGFGGLWAARALARKEVDVLLIDRNNYHTFLPLLYQVAAAELEPEDIVHPVRSILRNAPNIQFVLAEVTGLDLNQRLVETGERPIAYDFLILAIGSTSFFFGVQGTEEYAFPLKTLEEAINLRNHILGCFEKAVHEPDPELRNSLLTFAIVGGGPTGVEFAGALAELIHGPLRKDYPTLDLNKVRVMVIETLDRLLPTFPQALGEYSLWRLTRTGVEVLTTTRVQEITESSVLLEEGIVIPSRTVVWTAGVQGNPAPKNRGLPTAKNGQVEVLPTLQVPGHPEIYVIGDLARLPRRNLPLPMLAPVAIQEGTHAAKSILREISGQTSLPFQYRDRGSMVTIGRNAAVARLRGRNFTGFLAWLLWLWVHLFNLIGFRNRLIVLINWAWDYFLSERVVRLIIPSRNSR